MRIGLVSPYDYATPGGVNQHIQHLAGQLRAVGHEVGVLAPSSKKQIHDAGFHRVGGVVPIPANDSVARINLNLTLSRRVSEILEQERFDVLHFHEPFMPALPITVLRMSRTANVGTFHAFARSNVGYYYGRGVLSHYLRRLHATVAVSQPARDFLRHYFPAADPEIVPNGVDVARFRPGLSPIRHLQDGCVNYLFVGRLEKRKGLRDLLQAFQYLHQRVPRTRLIIVGEGPLRHRVESFIHSRKLDGVVLAGRVPAEVLPRYHASADVFCAPATGRESFGIILLEAMAAGLPVVCTEIPGYLSVVEAGVDSLTVRPRSPVELGAAMTVLARDGLLRKRLGEEGLKKARHRFAWPVVTSQLMDVYEKARRRARSTGAPVQPSPVIGVGAPPEPPGWTHMKEVETRAHDALPGVG
ncbi:MAG: glycosyltransferase family 4 protein [Candidatus Dormibacteraeota bacterium]|nr:glycosyltransferase family 4 protein [Candidatus Dormibacteraeota bacterium]